MTIAEHKAASSPSLELRKPLRQLVVLLPDRLIATDTIVPLILQIKGEVPSLAVHFLFIYSSTVATTRSNYVLWRGMTRCGRVAYLRGNEPGLVGRALALRQLAAFYLRLATRPSLLLAPFDFGDFPFNWLARAARLGGGAALTFAKRAYPMSQSLRRAHDVQTGGRYRRFRDPGEATLIYHPAQFDDYACYGVERTIVMGTPRAMPAWRRHLDLVENEAGIVDVTGAPIAFAGRPRLALFYPGDVVTPDQHTPPRVLLHRFLGTVKAVVPGATVVIKPHALCDLNHLAGDLRQYPDVDVHVTNAHPQLLARRVDAAVFTNGSNVMSDMYVERRPVLDLADYKAEIVGDTGSLYPHPLCRACQDVESLAVALRDLAAGAPVVAADGAGDSEVWPMPQRVWPMLAGEAGAQPAWTAVEAH